MVFATTLSARMIRCTPCVQATKRPHELKLLSNDLMSGELVRSGSSVMLIVFRVEWWNAGEGMAGDECGPLLYSLPLLDQPHAACHQGTSRFYSVITTSDRSFNLQTLGNSNLKFLF